MEGRAGGVETGVDATEEGVSGEAEAGGVEMPSWR